MSIPLLPIGSQQQPQQRFIPCAECKTTAQCRMDDKRCRLAHQAGTRTTVLPTDPQERKDIPVCTGVLDYFPLAIAEIAKVSMAGNKQHNPGQPLHWARNKSMDFPDTIVRHIMERGTLDSDGQRHSAKLAWRVLGMLQIELEEAFKLPISRGSTE